MDIKQIQHLYWRAGFGLSPNQLKEKQGKTKLQIVDELFSKSKTFEPLLIDTPEIDTYTKVPKNASAARKRYTQLNSIKIEEYNYAWIYRMVNTKRELREKMTLFWANHFVCKDGIIKSTQQYNNVLRNHALGNFKDFVIAISKENSMIRYLNLNTNNKEKPNENFARELLELFTLGVGNYSEQDIKEAARAFTGYKTNFKAEFKFNSKRHDSGKKVFLGKKGKFKGDDIIDIILQQRQCAEFVCTKIYKYFVNESINRTHINAMTNLFYKDYNIERLMRFVFSSDWFYGEENIGSKIKSPIELIVGMHRTVPLKFNKSDELLKIQDVLDQKLLYPPNVAGWKGGKNWINTNSMLVRVKLPSMILEKESYTIKPKGNFTKSFQFVYVKNKYQDKLDVSVGWKTYKKQSRKLKSSELLSALILCELSLGAKSYIRSLGKLTRKRNLSKIMSLPEYQMC